MMPNRTKFNDETDLLLIDLPELLTRIHIEFRQCREPLDIHVINMFAAGYSAEAFIKEGTSYYLFRFKSAKAVK